MKRLVPILAALAAAACGSAAPQLNDSAPNGQLDSAEASGPVFQLPVIPGRPGAAYFTVEVPAGHGGLVGVTSPQAGRVEMHETMRRGTMSGMRPLERIAPDNGRIVLARGGRHLMLFDVDQTLVAGGRAQLILRFEHGQTRTLEARVTGAENAHADH